MAFDIRAIFGRSLGGRQERESPQPVAEPEELTDEEMPGSPIVAAATSAAAPETGDMTHGGASAATALIPEGLAAMPSASVDLTSSGRDDDSVDSVQAELVAEVAIAAAMMHGKLSAEQRDDLLESLRELPGLEDFRGDDLTDMIETLAPEEDDFASRMEDRLEEMADELTDPVLRRAAYQLAVYFCAWDGGLAESETDLLMAIAEAFELNESEAHSLREATIQEAGQEGWEPGASPSMPG